MRWAAISGLLPVLAVTLCAAYGTYRLRLSALRVEIERRRNQERLRLSEERFRRAIEAVPIILCSVDADTNRVLLLEGNSR